MVTRRALIGGLGALVAGGGFIAGSGAFTGATAQRTVSVEFADDSDAYLALGPIRNDDRDNVTVAENGDGVVEITVTEINANARTVLGSLVAFTNNSPRAIERMTVEIQDRSENAALSITNTPDSIPAGETVTGLGLVVDTRDYTGQPELGATISIRSVLAPEEEA
jgi:hypothetical protein